MLMEPMMEKLVSMRLQGMVDGLKAQQQDPAAGELSFQERSACWSTSNGTGAKINRWAGA
jgi:hypothetical protein